MSTTLNIKHFGDYRDFLKAHLQTRQAANPRFSLGLWSKKLGLENTSSLSRIMKGERDPGDSITERLNTYFNFDENEQSYFEDLIRLSKNKDDVRLRVMLMEKMGREHPDARLTIIDDRSAELIGHWFCQTLREMTKLKDFKEDTAWIKKRLLYPITDEEILWAIDICLHQGLLRRLPDGKLKASEGLLHTTNDIASKAIRKYHRTTLSLAQEAMERTPVEFREVTAETFTISKKMVPEAKECIRSFKAKMVRMLEDHEGDETYQLQIQFFPLTKDDK